ncbi:MAG: hypothetical protein MZW92_71695 [Comamonadaceae bacterium]|nr:hypothetical protein [Comamonadaceae bacterium]
MRTQPKRGLRRFISTMAAMSSAEGPLGPGFAAMRRGRKEQAVLALYQGLVELEQRGRLDERAQLRNPARIHEQRGQTEHDAIERGQIRCALSGSIADQKLMFEQKRLRGDGACARMLSIPFVVVCLALAIRN